MNHFVRRLCLVAACIATGTIAAHGAFDLVGQPSAPFVEGSVIVQRNSLEERSSSTVASAVITNGELRMHVDAEPGLFNVRVGETNIPFVAGDSQILRLVAGSSGVRVEGAVDQELFVSYETFRAESLSRLVHPIRTAIANAGRENNRAEVERLTEAEIVAYQKHRRELNDFTLEKLRGSPALYAASLRWDGDYRLEELAAAVREFVTRHPRLEISRSMSERIERFLAISVGATAPPLNGRAPDGRNISLEGLRGRLVLVDFWAAWCSPCRIQNRQYARIYETVPRDRFEILAVSLDDDQAAWSRAIVQDNAQWLHISDLSGWKSPLAARYNVTALPASFLVDPSGKIIAKDVRAKELIDLIASQP